MKRGKDEEKRRGPMFPRLHVNDTEKGGPRPPPRNKMALYEQLSIPSQRFNHTVVPVNPNYTAPNLVPPSSQGVAIDRGTFFSYQLPTRHQPDKQYSQYSDLSAPLIQVEERRKLDEDDFRVPIFVHSVPSQQRGDYNNDLDKEKTSPSKPSYFNHPSKFQKSKKMGMLESSMVQEDKCQNEGSSKEFPTDRVKAISNSSTIEKAEGLKKQTESSVCHEPRDSLDRLRTHDNVEPELRAEQQSASKRGGAAILGENIAELDKRNSSTSMRALPSEDQNILRDISNDTESREDGSSRSLRTRNLERGDSVSETSVVDSISGLDVTPDDVVGVIGPKRFWKARRAIVDQQRVFAIQVFELHRLIKVQRLIAASPNVLEDSAYLSKPIKPLAGKRIPSNYLVKPIPSVSKQKGEPEKQSHKKESSAENTIGKASFSSIQNGVLPSTCRPPLSGNSPAPSISSNYNARPWCFNQPPEQQWLIPVMSPSEGLVYKPYPGPGFVTPACGGCGPPVSNPAMGNFLTPVYGVPAPHPQYQLPSFPPAGPHGYFPPYGMPVMNAAAFSGSSVEQTPTPGPGPFPGQISDGEPMPSHQNQAPPGVSDNLHESDEIEVQISTASSPLEREQDSRASSAMEGRNVLPLFPTAPAIDASNSGPQPERPTQVIKVVPHNARSATESAARIFQSIQEERKQYDSA